MMIGGWMRRTAFWTLDALRGGSVRKHYRSVKNHIEQGLNNEAQLKILLEHAVRTSSFYKDCDPTDISSFPILTKHDLKTNIDAVRSDTFKGKPIHQTSTSGSTGIPLTVWWDPEKLARQRAELIYFYERAEHQLGEPFITFHENQHKKAKSSMTQWQQNMYDYDVTSFDDEKLDQICQRLMKRPAIQCYLAYGSFHEAMAKHLRARDYDPSAFRMTSLVSCSEVFPMSFKEELHQRTGARIYDRYSNEENGFFAQTEHLSDEFWVNTASFRVEILKQDSDEPAEAGEVGRIVITDLYNLAVPMIRYDTGDLSIRLSEKDGWTTGLKTIQGRQSDVVYDTRGGKMTTCSWNAYMGDFNELKQYQLIQEGPRAYTLKVNGAKGIYEDSEFVLALQKAIGMDAEVTIQHVDGIPALSSGKFKKTVCNYQYNPADYA